MTKPSEKLTKSKGIISDGYFQISDDDYDECEELGDDCLLEEIDSANNIAISRGPYERAWTTDATRALIHIRGPMEGRFTEGRQKRTALWLHCTRQLQKLGYRYNAAKVQKKWHNILITYNKNLSKKYVSGYVHWEFFEDMFKYLQGKKADFEVLQNQQYFQDPKETKINFSDDIGQYMCPELQPHVQIDENPNDEFDEVSTVSEKNQSKFEYHGVHPVKVPLHKSHSSGFESGNANDSDYIGMNSVKTESVWWKDYFERKLDMDGEKIQLQKEMHRDMMQFNKMALLQQEKTERIKIDSINSLTCTLQKLIEIKSKKV